MSYSEPTSDLHRTDTAPGDQRLGRAEIAEGIKSYLVGLGLSILLTVMSFFISGTTLVWGPSIPVALVVLAIAQMGVHLVFFLHITTAPDNVNNVLALAFGVLIVLLVLAGSLWIMAHLNYNIKPMDQMMQMQLERGPGARAITAKGVVGPATAASVGARVSGVIQAIHCNASMQVEAAQTVEQAVQARIENGLATKPEFLQAQQQTAQSAFDVEAARGAESDARVALIESIGILPTVPLKVADLGQRLDLDQAARSVDELIAKALSQRPDLVAKLANVHAKEHEIRKIRAEYYPKVLLDAHVSETELDVSIAGSKYFGDDKPTFGALLTVSVPIFDGFARRHKMEMAEAALQEAENELSGARDARGARSLESLHRF
jgi:cytochrome o ubiquinol oxidase operon protein cyoD